jgi:hypothetical protein
VILRSRVRDCLFLNWALPGSALPEPPESLRYQIHRHEGRAWAFASALLFRQQGIHLISAPWARISYPQLNLRFYTLDRDDVPSVLFHAMWTPAWVVPAARFIGRQPVRPARMSFPPAVEEVGATFDWRVSADAELRLSATGGAATVGAGPRIGSWAETVCYFRQRPRGYCVGTSGLRRVETTHVSTAVWPMEVELERTSLLESCVTLPDGWPALHSAWVCPELAFDFEVLPESEAALAPQLPAPG